MASQVAPLPTSHRPGTDELRLAGETTPGKERIPPAALLWMALLTLVGAALFFWDLTGHGFIENEGRYAEVAREMRLTGDWITPHMNGEVFLNKPPLLFWLTALCFQWLGYGESVRFLSGLATLATMWLLFDLGRRLWSVEAGLWSAVVFLTAVLTVVEARLLRPDAILTGLICLSLWGAVRIDHSTRPDRLAQAAFWSGLGLGVMTKGFLGVVVPGMVLLPAILLAGRLREWRRYMPWWGPILTVALVLPWHLAAGLRNEGFWWDYVINQHLLVFFDRKFPRDHIPHPLPVAWGAFAARLFPWLLLLPAAWIAQYRQARADRTVSAWLPLTWFTTIWAFFSLSKGRLEHHFIPAVPGAVLLIGAFCARWREESGAGPRIRALFPLAVAGIGAVGAGVLPAFFRKEGFPALAPGIDTLAGGTMLLIAIGGFVALLPALWRRWDLTLGLLAVTFAAMGGCTNAALQRMERYISARPLIRELDHDLLRNSEIAYEAGQEYQLCGVLNYYLERKLQLLEPPGFIPPTYLRQDISRLFVKRPLFWQEWAAGKKRFLLFTDPDLPVYRPSDFSQPQYEVARDGRQMVLTNLPLPSRSERTSADLHRQR